MFHGCSLWHILARGRSKMGSSPQRNGADTLSSGDLVIDGAERSRFRAWTFILSSFVSWIIVTIGIGILVTIALLLVGFSESTSINIAILASYLAIIPLTILLIYADGSIDPTIDSMRLKSARSSLYLLIAIPVAVTVIDFILVILYGFSYSAAFGEPSPNTDIGITWDSSLAAIGITFFSIAILAPIAEELMFRGYILESIKKLHGDAVAVFASSILFGIAHFPDPFTIGMATIGGAIYGFVKVKTGSLWPSLVSHLIWNSIALSVTYL